MTKSELWLIYVKKNPSFEGRENITMTPKGLKKLFDQTWEIAQETAKSKEKFDPGIFGDIFKR
jgi:hypothetical protein